MKKTVVIGASDNPERYAYKAANLLTQYKHEVVPVGLQKGELVGKPILNIKEKPKVDEVDTVTLYVSPKNLKDWHDYIIDLNPKRIIFNPGTENPELERLAQAKGIETVEGCTLVMLRVGAY